MPSTVTGQNGSGWSITGIDQRLVVNADNSTTYYGPQGLTGVFPVTAAGVQLHENLIGRWQFSSTRFERRVSGLRTRCRWSWRRERVFDQK